MFANPNPLIGVVRQRDPILLYLDEKRKFLTRAEPGKAFHTHRGFINLDDVVGKPFGSRVVSSLGFEFTVLKPSITDFIVKIRRRTQIIYPQDIGIIIMFAGIGPGDRVVEGGTGSGVATCALAYHVKPSGKVYSYDIRQDLLDAAEENLRKLGLIQHVELKNKSVTDTIDEGEVDAVLLDIPTPWLAVSHAYEALKDCGYLISISPTIEQVVNTVEALKETSFVDVRTFENMLRPIRVKRGMTRPEMLMVGHTGYLTFARKARR